MRGFRRRLGGWAPESALDSGPGGAGGALVRQQSERRRSEAGSISDASVAPFQRVVCQSTKPCELCFESSLADRSTSPSKSQHDAGRKDPSSAMRYPARRSSDGSPTPRPMATAQRYASETHVRPATDTRLGHVCHGLGSLDREKCGLVTGGAGSSARISPSACSTRAGRSSPSTTSRRARRQNIFHLRERDGLPPRRRLGPLARRSSASSCTAATSSTTWRRQSASG